MLVQDYSKMNYLKLEMKNEKELFEIRDVLNALGKQYVDSLMWFVFDIHPVGSIENMAQAKELESQQGSFKEVSGKKLLEVLEKVETDWGTCIGFKTKPVFPEDFVKKLHHESEAQFNHDQAEIEIRSFDGSYVFVVARDNVDVERLNSTRDKQFYLKQVFALIRKFTEGKISAKTFHDKYLVTSRLVRNASGKMPDYVDEILGNMYSDCDVFEPNPDLFGKYNIGEEEFTRLIKEKWEKLQKLEDGS